MLTSVHPVTGESSPGGKIRAKRERNPHPTNRNSGDC